jgi:hypothetical protein
LRVSDRVFGHALRLRNSAIPRSTGSFISQLRELEQIREMVTRTSVNPLFQLFSVFSQTSGNMIPKCAESAFFINNAASSFICYAGNPIENENKTAQTKQENPMDIIFYHPTFDTDYWLKALSAALPGARVREWKRGDKDHADYALVWHPPVEMLQGRLSDGG